MAIPEPPPENTLKNAKNNNLLKTERMLKPKYKLSAGLFLHLACHGERFAPLPPSFMLLVTVSLTLRLAITHV